MLGKNTLSQLSNLAPIRVMRKIWDRLTRPAAAIQGSKVRRRARLIASFLVVIILLFALNDLIKAFSQPDFRLPPANIVGYSMLIAAYILSRTRYSHLAAMLTVAMFIVVTFQLTLTTDTPALTLTYMIPSLLMLSIWLSVWKTALVLLAVFVGMLLLPVLAPEQVPSLQSIDAALGVNGMTFVLLLIVMRYRDHVEGERLAALTKANQELLDLQKTLQQRVTERTHDLEAAAQVARDAAFIRDVNQLLDQTIRLISERFGFYHVGIFLLDEAGEQIVLQAASSERGQHMLTQAYKLKVGEPGIVGYVADTGEPHIVSPETENTALSGDSAAPPAFASVLPETRSELALPLKSRERVIGVLDVQSREAEAFSEEDVAVLQVMTDQLAVAIENAQLLQSTQQTVYELSSAISEILSATSQQSTGASEQSAAIDQASSTIDEIRTIAEQTSQRAQGVAEVAQRTATVSKAGQAAVAETVSSMDEVKQKVEMIAHDVLALSEQTQAIGQIIATVSEIAAQSNMLALNAAVEAARAGEAGRGFAVVAAEVRTLAEQSRAATVQVQEILSEIQRGVNAAVMATEEGMKGTEKGMRVAGEAGLSIQRLAEGVSASNQAASQIAAAAGQQQAGMEQVAQAIEHIDRITAQSVSGAQQVERAAGDLHTLAGRLRELVEQYRS